MDAEPLRPMFDAWGLPIIPPAVPPIDPEIGLTADEDGQWEPPSTGLPLGQFLLILTVAAAKWITYLICKTGLHRRRPR